MSLSDNSSKLFGTEAQLSNEEKIAFLNKQLSRVDKVVLDGLGYASMTAQDMDSVQEIEPGMTLEEIQIDSMYKINVLLDVEDTLGLIDYEVFPIHDTENIETAQDMINAVKKSIESEIQKLKAESEKI